MANIVSDTGFWIENNPGEHYFSLDLSKIINHYVRKNGITTVYDFGCGNGEYLYELSKRVPNVKATGFEGHNTNGVYDNVVVQDLSVPFQLEPADLAISIEVGEHIPKEFEQIFIDNVSNNASKHIILSWAIEGQPGLGHVNCQNNDYVIAQLEKRGWTFDAELSHKLRFLFNEGLWLRNTLMFFTR